MCVLAGWWEGGGEGVLLKERILLKRINLLCSQGSKANLFFKSIPILEAILWIVGYYYSFFFFFFFFFFFLCVCVFYFLNFPGVHKINLFRLRPWLSHHTERETTPTCMQICVVRSGFHFRQIHSTGSYQCLRLPQRLWLHYAAIKAVHVCTVQS